MQRFAQSPQTGLVEGLTQGRMGVDCAADILKPRPHLEREREARSELRHARADGSDTQHQVIVGARGHAHEAVLVGQGERAAVGLEGELRHMHLAAGLARFLRREPHRHDLGIGEAHRGNHRAVEHASVARDLLGHHHALRHGAMGEHRLAGEVADRPHVAHRRGAVLVDLHETIAHREIQPFEAEDRLLPAYDAELVRPVARRLQALGVETLAKARAVGLSEAADAVLVEQAGANRRSIPADRVLVATGRRARLDGFGLERLDLTVSNGFVQIDEHCATSMRNVWAVGDLTGEPMLAHRAMAQGVVVAEQIAGHRRVFDSAVIPAVCFTDPEIVTVGLSPEEARKAGREVHVAQFPFQANGRALTLADDDGFVRVTARADNHLVLGIAAVGPGVSELSSAFALALEMGARLEDIGGTIHAHPTLGEAFHEASLRALGEALHI